MALFVPMTGMTSQEPSTSTRLASKLDASFDTLIRRVEHAQTLHERQCAIDSLFERRCASMPSEPIVPLVSSDPTDPFAGLPLHGARRE